MCAGQAGAGHSSPHPVPHAKVLHLISSLVSPGSLRPRPRAVRQLLHVLGRQGLDSRIPWPANHPQEGRKLDVSMYNVFCNALTDDYEGVRFEALTILDAMAETDSEYQVEVDTGASRSVVGGQTIGLVDDVFSRTCQGACEGTGGPADRGYEGREPGLPRADPGQEADEQHEEQEERT